MEKKFEADIEDMMENEQDRGPLTDDFKAKLYDIVIEHRLREFHLFYLCSIRLTI